MVVTTGLTVTCFNKFIALKFGNSNVLNEWTFSIFLFMKHTPKLSKGSSCYKNAARIQYLKTQKQPNKNNKIKLLQKWKWNYKTTVINVRWPRSFNKICLRSQICKNKKREQFCGTGAQAVWLFLHFLCKTSKLSKFQKKQKQMQTKRFSTSTKYGKPNKNCTKYSEIVFAVIFRLWGWGKKN